MLLKRVVVNTCSIRRLTTYKRWEIDSFSPNLNSLKLVETNDVPIVDSAFKVLVEVKAASINPIDVLISQGYGHSLFRLARVGIDMMSADKLTYDKFPMVLGRDFCGTIVRKGPAVDNVNVGDDIWGVIPPYINHGSHGNLVVTSKDHISRKPKNISEIESASIPYAGLTAYSAISCFGGLNEGNSFNKNVLVLGGTGGVGLLAIQLLKSWGAMVTTTCNSNAIEWLKSESNADQVIDYNDSSELSRLSNSFDLVFNASSSGQRVVDGTLALLKKGTDTIYVTVTSPWLSNYDNKGYIGGTIQTIKDVTCDTVRGIKDGKQIRWAYFMPNGLALSHIKRLVEENQVKATIEKVVEFEKAKDGYLKVQDGHSRGKTVIKMN